MSLTFWAQVAEPDSAGTPSQTTSDSHNLVLGWYLQGKTKRIAALVDAAVNLETIS